MNIKKVLVGAATSAVMLSAMVIPALAKGPSAPAGNSNQAHLYLYEKNPADWSIVDGGAYFCLSTAGHPGGKGEVPRQPIATGPAHAELRGWERPSRATTFCSKLQRIAAQVIGNRLNPFFSSSRSQLQPCLKFDRQVQAQTPYPLP